MTAPSVSFSPGVSAPTLLSIYPQKYTRSPEAPPSHLRDFLSMGVLERLAPRGQS